MKFENYLSHIPEINVKKEYWFVRTEHGEYYKTFKSNDFIAIGWNEITIEDINKSFNNQESIKSKIALLSRKKEEDRAKKIGEKVDVRNIIDLIDKRGKMKATTIVNKLQIFSKLKRGDIVVIPNDGSSVLSFGIVDDDYIYIDSNKSNNCNFSKRRKVKWICEKRFNDLDKAFFVLKRNMHAISSIKTELAEHIDRVMNNVYFKDGYGYYVVRVKKQTDIPAKDLFELGADLMEILKLINDRGGYNESINNTIIKISVQSKGDFLLKGEIGKCIIALAFVVNTIGCSTNAQQPKNLGIFEPQTEKEKKTLQNLRDKIDSLQIEVSTR